MTSRLLGGRAAAAHRSSCWHQADTQTLTGCLWEAGAAPCAHSHAQGPQGTPALLAGWSGRLHFPQLPTVQRLSSSCADSLTMTDPPPSSASTPRCPLLHSLLPFNGPHACPVPMSTAPHPRPRLVLLLRNFSSALPWPHIPQHPVPLPSPAASASSPCKLPPLLNGGRSGTTGGLTASDQQWQQAQQYR